MSNTCFESNCTGDVCFVCTCSEGKKTYCCKDHQATHCSSPGDHHIKPLLIYIPDSQHSELVDRIFRALTSLKKLEFDAFTLCETLLNNIIAIANKSISTIRETEQFLSDFYQKLLTKAQVNMQHYELIPKLIIPDALPNMESFSYIMQEISKIFKINFSPYNNSSEPEDTEFDSDMVIAPFDRASGLFSIDLDTFTFDLLSYAPSIGIGVQAARISQDSYFFYGGMKSVYNGEVFILNTQQRNCKSYPSSSILGYGASVYKQGKVYIFGGLDNGYMPIAVNKCKIFEIASSRWSDGPSLPTPLVWGTAAIINKKIMVTGHNTENIYAYERDSYVKVLSTEDMSYKVLCPGWLVTQSALYECKGEGNDQWEVYPSCWIEGVLWMPVSFKKGKFIYFVNGDSNSLWRVDTEEKKIEQVSYY